MNRDRIRNLTNQGLSVGQIVKIAESEAENIAYEKGFKAGMHEVIEIVYYMTAYTLDYKLDYNCDPSGNEKLVTMMKYIFNNIDSYRTGHLTTEDFEQIKKEMQSKGVTMR